MKNAKLIFSTILFSLLFSVTAQSQEKKAVSQDKNQNVVQQPQAPVDPLALEPTQQAPYREIIKRYAEKMRDVKKSILSKEERKVKMNEIDLERDAEMKVLLSEQQYKTYLKLQEERRAKIINMRKQN